jgi:hypothetical protein
MITDNPKGDTRTYRGISYRKPIDEAKRLVPVPDLAEKLSGAPGVKRGRELAYICPLHDDHSPSLRVDPDKGVWFCDPCLVGGDAVKLYRLARGYDEREARTAAGMLLMEFGHEVPEPPPAYFRKQERQRRTRDAIDREKVEHVRMLVFRLIWVPWLRDLPEWMRDEAKVSAWESSRNIAKILYEQRGSA